MKNATKYQTKIKKFLSGIRKSATPPPADRDRFHVMIDAILAAEAPNQSAKALDDLQKEFVDFNELRVAPVKEIVDALGRDFPDARRKAEEITSVLNAIFSSRNSMGLDYVEKMPKRDLRRHLHELGLSPFPAAVMMMQVFGGHAIPVDQGLVDCLEIDGYIEPGSSIEEVHAFLERIILQKQAPAAHEFFREYVAKNAKMLAKKRKAATVKAEALAAAEAAKAEAEAKAKAAVEAKKAQAQAKAEAEAKAKAKAEARKQSAHKRAAAKASAKSAAKSTRRAKAQPKATKKASKKASRKTKDK